MSPVLHFNTAFMGCGKGPGSPAMFTQRGRAWRAMKPSQRSSSPHLWATLSQLTPRTGLQVLTSVGYLLRCGFSYPTVGTGYHEWSAAQVNLQVCGCKMLRGSFITTPGEKVKGHRGDFCATWKLKGRASSLILSCHFISTFDMMCLFTHVQKKPSNSLITKNALLEANFILQFAEMTIKCHHAAGRN